MWPRTIQRALVAVLCLIAVSSVAGVDATPPVGLWERWRAHDANSARKVDHGAWEVFLRRYVRIGPDNIHRVAYGMVTPADRKALDDYLAELSRTPISHYDRAAQLAFWINLYNALTVKTVLQHYPVASIRHVPGPGRLAQGPWDAPLIEVEAQALSLNDIHDRILRPIWRDPRILYALSCGALGCPNLQPAPFTRDQLDHQLSEAAMAYINDPRCIQIEEGQLVVSSLLRWYREDFGGSDRAVINHLMGFAEPRLAMKLQRFDRIDGDVFDWRLNDATN